MNDEEIRRTVELPRYFVVLPAFKSVYGEIDYEYPEMIRTGVENPYNSAIEKAMSKKELRQFLYEHKLL